MLSTLKEQLSPGLYILYSEKHTKYGIISIYSLYQLESICSSLRHRVLGRIKDDQIFARKWIFSRGRRTGIYQHSSWVVFFDVSDFLCRNYLKNKKNLHLVVKPWYSRNEKREFASEFSQLSCPGQTRTRVAWELRRESLHQNFLNSQVLVKREQELHESWEARVCIRVFSTLMARSNENKSCMKVDKSWLDITGAPAQAILIKIIGWGSSLGSWPCQLQPTMLRRYLPYDN
jgi:hypothetical protein